MRIALVIILLLNGYIAYAQADSSVVKYEQLSTQFPEKLSQKLEDKYQKLDKHIEATNTKLINQLQNQENKLRKKIAKLDSNKAKQIFNNNQLYYSGIKEKLNDKQAKLKALNEYIPKLDSLSAATKFLETTGVNLNKFSPQKLQQIKELNNLIGKAQTSLQNAAEVRKMLSERKKQLQQALQQYNFGKEFKKINKTIYYYQEQITQYKDLLKDKNKLEEKALAYIREIPAFKVFMQKNSWLAQLFPTPNNIGTAQALAGLQTRVQIQQQIQNSLASNTNSSTYMQQQVQQAQAQLNQIKDKINQQIGGGDGDASLEMPNFKPNNQKTKTFWQRVEYGFNMQSKKANSIFPSSADIAATAGYKLNDKTVLGVGLAYKLGLGKDIQHIQLSHQGIGLRTYVDIKLPALFPFLGGAKGGQDIWITGGYEQNYLHEITKYEQLKNLKAWQQSGLLGVTKKYKIGKTTNNMQLLWDFLSYTQTPKTEAIKFRVGFKL